ncbi:MAG TPA: SpoIID/LytB domain-containing protein [Chroococcales cyanobacterium]
MQIRVGLTTSDLTDLLHKSVSISSSGVFTLVFAPASQKNPQPETAPHMVSTAAVPVTVTSKGGVLHITGVQAPELKRGDTITVIHQDTLSLTIDTISRIQGGVKKSPQYLGQLQIIAAGDQVRVILLCDLEDYIKGVLQSEIPASYHMEAIKAQAVAARTYALRPRIDHTADQCNVCDSYLCCQYFAGLERISNAHREAIAATRGKILTYNDQPILALFSSCAGGHTESFDNCFSDPGTNQFPPAALPYLVGVSESKFNDVIKTPLTEQDLRRIYSDKLYHSVDSWSPNFRWRVHMPASALEAHMHEEVRKLQLNKEMAPFVQAPPSGQFGHIQSFEVGKRGVAGTAILLSVNTSRGVWTFTKELVIRSAFKNSELKLARLKSARFFIDEERDQLGLLSSATISGFGWGHGVGMQQTGAQGWARQGKTYSQILGHYFQHAVIQQV